MEVNVADILKSKFFLYQHPKKSNLFIWYLLSKVNCDGSGRVTCSLYDIKGYPTIKVFNFGEFVFNYDGPKSSGLWSSFPFGDTMSAESLTHLKGI